ncbi:MAG: L,D-transpeptidase, partial [Caldilineaceae bacterium]|nr:L,D-transpeptidase [Caldilinea sp.]MCB0149975.1 L,D-transpeptidase [Caldilineaceae bacterium]
TAWQGDVPIFETTVSTGKPGFRTLPGTFAVYRKYEETRMRGIDYDTPDVPWTMYYDGSFAIHGAYWHNNFGTPVSHGCVNLRVPEAKALFEWADVGTEVVVTQ